MNEIEMFRQQPLALGLLAIKAHPGVTLITDFSC